MYFTRWLTPPILVNVDEFNNNKYKEEITEFQNDEWAKNCFKIKKVIS